MKTLLRTIHGSHLYGLNHASSDRDSYEILLGAPKKYAKQKIQDNDDTFQASFQWFMGSCANGTPQALEALFSPYAEMDAAYEDFFDNFRVGLDAMRQRYRRTILNFGFPKASRLAKLNNKDLKKSQRHAFRLAFNLDEAMRTGRFDPRMSSTQREFLEYTITLSHTEYGDLLTNTLEHAMLGELSMLQLTS